MVVDLQELARRMLADYDARTPGRLFAEPLDLTTAQAYALQAEIARFRGQRGEHVIGYKVGCTSRPIQVQLGVKEPIFGRIFDTGCHPSGVHLSSANYANLAGGESWRCGFPRTCPLGHLRPTPAVRRGPPEKALLVRPLRWQRVSKPAAGSNASGQCWRWSRGARTPLSTLSQALGESSADALR